MRILIVVGSYYLGGAEFHAFKLAKYFKSVGVEVRFVAFTEGDGTTQKMCFESGVETELVKYFFKFKSGVRGYFQRKFYINYLKQYKPDAIVAFNYCNNVWAGIMGELANIPCTIWSQQSEFKEGWNIPRSIEASKKISGFISNAKHVSIKLKKDLQVERLDQDFHVVYNGIEPQVPKNSNDFWRNKLNLDNYCKVATMVANLTQTKDHVTLLKAWKLVIERWDQEKPPLLVLAGRCGNTYENVLKLIDELEINEYVNVLGGTNDVAGLNNVSDLGILSSKAEGLPNAVMEQMLSGLPIVGSDNDGTKEAVGEEMERYLSPIENHEDLADKICTFLSNPNLTKKVGLKNKERIESVFSVQRMGEDTLSIIRKYVEEFNRGK